MAGTIDLAFPLVLPRVYHLRVWHNQALIDGASHMERLVALFEITVDAGALGLKAQAALHTESLEVQLTFKQVKTI